MRNGVALRSASLTGCPRQRFAGARRVDAGPDAKSGRREAGRNAVLGWADSFDVVDSTWASVQSAFDLSVTHEFRMWAALVMAVANENRCRIVPREDLQHGFTWRGVMIVDPFLPDESPLLAAMLSQAAEG